ncbi:MAG: endopeptidase La [Desulfobacteraceae bacterium]|nr:endopeptidase La [Desulfobacteraceae bacterium]
MNSMDQASINIKTDQIPDILPILPIVDTNLFPKMVLPLVLVQQEAIDLIDEAMAGDRILGLILSKRSEVEERHTTNDLYKIGTAAVILKMSKMEDDKAQLLIQGVSRFKVEEYLNEKTYIQARIKVLKNRNSKRSKANRALMANIIEQYEKIVKLSPGLPPEMIDLVKSLQEPDVLADMVASSINAPVEEKQKALEYLDVKKRLESVTRLVNDQLDILEMGSKIQSQVKEDMDKKQRDYYLRQQLKAIKEELGESDEENLEVKEYRDKIEAKELEGIVFKEALRELDRLSKMHPSSSEYIVSSTYLDWITTLPWNDKSKDEIDIKKARAVLDNDHYGLEKPKQRILEYLSVRKLKKDSKGPILCFSGPPGTGKTSLGKSIAKALGREFVRIALGGVRDEAEIRGHRRTYVGAMPGRIIQQLRRAGTNNPVFMLDEIDKVDSSYHGDPSSALLEVLDPEQNNSFTDHYLDLPFDLSDVIFLTTANVLHTIPEPLKDRMETLELNGYIEEEKIKIATKYLIPRQRYENGLKSSQIQITNGAIRAIISGYTRESGLRNLEREIGSVCRGVAAKIVEENTSSKKTIKVLKEDIPKFLGVERNMPDHTIKAACSGVVLGLAWTPFGGEILYIEAASMKGASLLTLTGHLGEVMKESANTALSYIRSKTSSFNIDEAFFEEHDIHIHVPEGAIPKDGPSAGVAMLTALMSLIIGKPVQKRLAMTGEITLRGDVLPVGGIKEKVIAAQRSGIRNIILPRWNEKDIEDVPEKIKKKIKFFFTDTMEEVLKIALDI